MIALFDKRGALVIRPETGAEAYALRKWWESWQAKGDATLSIDYEYDYEGEVGK